MTRVHQISLNTEQAGIPCTVYERDPKDIPRKRDWNMGLHWAWPAFQSLVPEALFDRIQTTQVDPSLPVKPDEHLPFLNGATGELLRAIPIGRFYRLRRSKIQALLMEGLDVQQGKGIAGITYSEDGKAVTANFEDGTHATGCLLIGADGPHSTVRKLLVGADNAKVTPIDYATTMCFSKHSREHALYLRSPPFHQLVQCAPHPSGYLALLGLHDVPNPDKPETWTFFHYISFPEPRDASSSKTTAERVAQQKMLAKKFADPFKSVYEWMPDDSTTAWYTRLQHWDPQASGHRWDNRNGRVTLAGDAAHPMTFQRGQGLNHAITDAWKIVQAIEKHWHGEKEGFSREERAKAIDEYEKEMIPRGSEEVRLGEMNTKMMHDWERVKHTPAVRQGLAKL